MSRVRQSRLVGSPLSTRYNTRSPQPLLLKRPLSPILNTVPRNYQSHLPPVPISQQPHTLFPPTLSANKQHPPKCPGSAPNADTIIGTLIEHAKTAGIGNLRGYSVKFLVSMHWRTYQTRWRAKIPGITLGEPRPLLPLSHLAVKSRKGGWRWTWMPELRADCVW